MKKAALIILSAVLSIAVVAGCAVGAVFFAGQTSGGEKAPGEYTIAVEQNVKVYVGESYGLNPRLINASGGSVAATFEYSASDERVEVGPDGMVVARSYVDDPVTVTVTAKERALSQDVEVTVVGKLERVLGVTFETEDGKDLMQAEEQEFFYGDEYEVEIVTEPRNVELEHYCRFEVEGTDAPASDFFDISYEGNKITVAARAIGKGKLTMAVCDADGEGLYEYALGFDVSFPDEVLTREILLSEGKDLVSGETIDRIETLTISDDVTDVAGLSKLPALDTIVLPQDHVMEVYGVTDTVSYRVPYDLYEEYVSNPYWLVVADRIFPYRASVEERYAILYNDRAAGEEEKSIYVIDENFTLPTFTSQGYVNDSWSDMYGNKITENDVKAVKKNGINLYADWRAAKYTVRYNVRMGGETITREQQFAYDELPTLLSAEEIYGEEIPQYRKFLGWTRNKDSYFYGNESDFFAGEQEGPLTAEDGVTIDLYDVWTEIEYTVNFSIPEDATMSAPQMKLRYSEEYALPSPARTGYTFLNWSYDGRTYAAGERVSELCPDDGGTVTFKAVEESNWKEHSYTLKYDTAGGTFVNGGDAESNKKMLKYTEGYQLLKMNILNGKKAYFWYADLNNNGNLDNTEAIYDAEAFVSKLTPDDNATVYMRAIWATSEYTVKFDANGGTFTNSSGSTYSKAYKYEENFLPPSVTRIGYTLSGWSFTDGGTTRTYRVGEYISKLTGVDGGTVTLKAIWEEKTYTINFSTQKDGKTNTQTMKKKYTESFAIPAIEQHDGYSVPSYWSGPSGRQYNPGTTYRASALVSDNYTTTLNFSIAYTIRAYTITETFGHQGDHVTNRTYTGTFTQSGKRMATYGSQVIVNVQRSDHNTWAEVTFPDGQKIMSTNYVLKFDMPAGDVTINFWCDTKHRCIASGSLITMADGSKAPVETLDVGSEVMVFNHETGRLDSAVISYIEHDGYSFYRVLNLYFGRDVCVKVIDTHGFFDIDEMKYVMITEDNVESFVGHRFFHTEGDGYEALELTGYKIQNEYVDTWSFLTAVHLNHVVEGMLGMAAETEGLYNIFELDEDLKYDEVKKAADIEKYGLYTYEDFKDLVPYEVYALYPAQYFKVAMGKGLLTWEMLFEYIENISS